MAKHRIYRTRIWALRELALAALVLGLGVSIGWAGQQPTTAPTARGKTAQARTRSAHASASAKSASPSSSAGEGRRDPFKLPEYGTGGRVADSEGGMEALPPGGVLPAGKRGLIVSQLKLEGVVRQQTANKMTALVVDHRNLAYFLHENDSVYNGVVSKITPDSIYFKENVLDSKGHVTTREVVRRLGAAPGEGR